MSSGSEASKWRRGRLTISDLGSVEQLQERFNRDQGAPRLVLTLAPT